MWSCATSFQVAFGVRDRVFNFAEEERGVARRRWKALRMGRVCGSVKKRGVEASSDRGTSEPASRVAW